jgi:hypothetical protein
MDARMVKNDGSENEERVSFAPRMGRPPSDAKTGRLTGGNNRSRPPGTPRLRWRGVALDASVFMQHGNGMKKPNIASNPNDERSGR